MTRFRTRVRSDRKGFYERDLFGSRSHWDASCMDKSTCDDEVHQGYPYTTDGPLGINYVDRSGFTTVSSKTWFAVGLSWIRASNMTPDVVKSDANWNHLNTGSYSASVDAAKVLAYSNPNRGEAEIGEDLLNPLGLPIRNLRKVGDNLIHNTADANLWWQFGFAPLIEDLKMIADYQKLLQQRLREFESLFKNGGLRRRVSLGKSSASSEQQMTLHSNVIPIIATVKITTVVESWGVVRWKPNGWSLSQFTDVDLEAMIRRLLYGLDLSPQTLWKYLPWTWLIGWFTNLNLLMAGAKSNFPVIPGNVSIMRHAVTTFEITKPSMNSNLMGCTGTLVRHTKTRQIVPSGGLPIAFMPAPKFGAGKSSILGSLAIQRLLPKGG